LDRRIRFDRIHIVEYKWHIERIPVRNDTHTQQNQEREGMCQTQGSEVANRSGRRPNQRALFAAEVLFAGLLVHGLEA